MKSIKSKSGKKAVNITNSNGSYVCMYVQIDHANQREQVLESKTYKTMNACEKYASRVLA